MHIVSNVVGDFNNKFSKLDTLLSGFPPLVQFLEHQKLEQWKLSMS